MQSNIKLQRVNKFSYVKELDRKPHLSRCGSSLSIQNTSAFSNHTLKGVVAHRVFDFMAWFGVMFMAISFFSFASAFINPVFVEPTPANSSNVMQPIIVAYSASAESANERGYSFLDFNNSLELWLTFDSLNASNYTQDLSGYGRNARLINNATINRAVFRTGTGSLEIKDKTSTATISSALNSKFNPSSGYSVSFWVKPYRNASGGILFGSISGAYNGTYFRIDNSTFGDGSRFNQNYGASSTILPVPLRAGSTNSEFNDAWQHYVIVQFGDYTTLYKNGRIYGGGKFPESRACNAITCINQSTSAFYIGSILTLGINAGVQGYYDDFMFFSRPIGAEEVSALYNYAGNVTTQAQIYQSSNGTKTFRAIFVNNSGGISVTENRVINAFNTGPFFYRTNASFNRDTNRSYASVLTACAFYGSSSSCALSNNILNATAHYRINNGAWQSMGRQAYSSWNSSEWGGFFGDSLISYSGTATWPRFLDGYMGSYIYTNPFLMRGVGGYRCDQVLSQINDSIPNNTKILFNCGANDAYQPAININATLRNITAIFQRAQDKNLSVYVVSVTPQQNLSLCGRIQTINAHFLNWYLYNNTNGFIKGYADVYNTSLKSVDNCGYNQSYFLDQVHPNDDGRMVIAQTVWTQALRGQVYDGWNNQFTPTVAGMYDVNFTVTNPTSESSSYVFEDLFSFGSYPKISSFP